MKKLGKPSPDRADALALTFAFPVKRKVSVDRAQMLPQHKGQTDFNPLEVM